MLSYYLVFLIQFSFPHRLVIFGLILPGSYIPMERTLIKQVIYWEYWFNLKTRTRSFCFVKLLLQKFQKFSLKRNSNNYGKIIKKNILLTDFSSCCRIYISKQVEVLFWQNIEAKIIWIFLNFSLKRSSTTLEQLFDKNTTKSLPESSGRLFPAVIFPQFSYYFNFALLWRTVFIYLVMFLGNS